MPLRPVRLPHWFHVADARMSRDQHTGDGTHWLERDRVRNVLSCIILLVLLGLIMIGGRKASWIRPPEADAHHKLLNEPPPIAPFMDKR